MNIKFNILKKYFLQSITIFAIFVICSLVPEYIFAASSNPAELLAEKAKGQLPTWISLIQLLVIAVLVWDFFRGVMDGNLPKQVIVQKLVLISLIGFAQPIVEFLMSWGSSSK